MRDGQSQRKLAPGWLDAAAVGGLGLYLGRVSTEIVPGARRGWEAAILTLLGLTVAYGLLAVLRRLQRPVPRSWILLLVYVLWPVASTTIAWIVALIVTVLLIRQLWSPGALQAQAHSHRSVLAAIIVFVSTLALYGTTVAPSVLPADSGEFQIVAPLLGIAHPPGYPLYTLLGKAATLIPVGDVAYRLNLLSVLFGALTLSIVALTIAQTYGKSSNSFWPAILGAGVLAVSPTFWSQATTANIRSLTALLTVLCLALLMRWAIQPTAGRLAAFGLAYGLAVGHHSSLALLAMPFAGYIVAISPRLLLTPRCWLPALGAFLGSFVVLLYLPIRSTMNPAFDPVPIDSVSRFFDHVLALGFRGDMLYFDTLPALVERARIYFNILGLQFGSFLPWFMLLALIIVVFYNWRLGLLLGGVWAVNALSALTYRAPQTVEYLLPSYVAMAITLGSGIHFLIARIQRPHALRWIGGLVLAALAVAVVWNGLAAWPDFRILHFDRSDRDYAEEILAAAPLNSLILANWHRATPFWYLQLVERQRPDVQVEYVYPQGAQPNEAVWLERIKEARSPEDDASRPVIVTNRYHAYENSPYQFIPLADAWLVQDGGTQEPPSESVSIDVVLEDQIRLDAYALNGSAPAPGGTLGISLYWHPTTALAHDYAVFVQLIGPEGVVAQADQAHPTSSYTPDVLRADYYQLPLLLQTLPGHYDLIAGFYRASDGGWERLLTPAGEDYVKLGEVDVTPSSYRPATSQPLTLNFEGGYRLRGADVDHGVPEQTRLYLHWERIHGDAHLEPLRVQAIANDQPLGGTRVPTLVAGQTATTVLDLPPGMAMPGRLTLLLTQADGTTQRLLGPWGMPLRRSATLHLPTEPTRYVPLGGETAYVGLAEQPGDAVAGEPFVVRPNLMALTPLKNDYSLSVGLLAPENGWERKEDGTPALGAIPTLKWLSGWVVTSPHAPIPPVDAPPGQALVTLSVYDAFTLEPLAVLDERLAAQGQGTFLVLGEIDIVQP